jgi:hypothetical protein
VSLVIALLIVIIFFWQNNQLNWRETFNEVKKNPYDTYVIAKLLESYADSKGMTLLKEGIKPLDFETAEANYVFIGQGMLWDTLGMNTLLSFVARGNRAFISSKTIPSFLINSVLDSFCNHQSWYDYALVNDTSVVLDLVHPELRMEKTFDCYKIVGREEKVIYEWAHFEPDFFCQNNFSPLQLGTLNDELFNFARLNYGDGAFYLHTTPIAFSNFHLLNQQGVSYAEKVFAHLADAPIYWDVSSQTSEQIARRLNEPSYQPQNRGLSAKGPMQYVLSQPSLAWAWYLTLALSLLYLLFRAKREQKIIPVLAEKKNTSLEFVTTIGRLYFLQQQHKELILKKMQLFLSDVRATYQLPTNELDEAFAERLSLRSKVPVEIIMRLIRKYQRIRNADQVEEIDLIEFQRLLSHF